jgi:hypothetical protein
VAQTYGEIGETYVPDVCRTHGTDPCPPRKRVYQTSCGHVVIPADIAEVAVVSRAVVAGGLYGAAVVPDRAPAVDLEPLKAKERKITGEIAEIELDMETGEISRRVGLREVTKLEERLEDVRKELAEAGSVTRAVRSPDQILRLLNEFEDLDLTEQRRIIRASYESIRLLKRWDDQANDYQRVVTRFSDWIPADAYVAGRDVVDVAIVSQAESGRFVDLEDGTPEWQSAAWVVRTR